MHPLAGTIRFVLVRPSHPGNIGAAARALKNMGFSRLEVVADDPPDLERAAPMATSARDLLDQLVIHPTVEAALAGVTWAVATTGRSRQWQYECLSARQLGAALMPRAALGDVVVLFGPENFGLDNEAVSRCQALCEIPTLGMKSLNLAQAVLVIAYELMMAASPDEPPPREVVELEAVEPVVRGWVEAWQAVGFLRGRNPDQFSTTLRQILGRAALEPRELAVLRGFFNKLSHYLRRTGGLPLSTHGDDPAG